MKKFISLLMMVCLLVMMTTAAFGYGTGNNLPPADPIVLKPIKVPGITVKIVKDIVLVISDYKAQNQRPVNSAPVSIEIVGKTVEIINDVQPYINSDSRTMVPVRAIVTLLGGEVSYNAATKSITIKKGLRNIMLTIGSDIVVVNGQAIQLDTSAEIFEGRTVVPIRFVTEALGYQVDFVPAIVSIN